MSDEDEMRELFGKALGEGFRAVMDMQLYGTACIGPEGRVDPRRVIDLRRPFEVSRSFEYDDQFAEARLSEHFTPLKGEVRGGRWDGLDVEAS